VLAVKVTGPGQRATLSALVQPGMKAVTIRVNDVEGVGGFVLPGDHVDVLLTRQNERANGTNDVVIQNARVLAVDQLADDAVDRPTVVKAVTLEVDTVSAQKIALAASLGNLSLMLRRAGEQVMDATRRITTSDLSQTETIQRAPEAKRFAKISVTRGTTKQEYNVASEEAEWRQGSEDLAASR
jgi:pilus assembly protein CpaB